MCTRTAVGWDIHRKFSQLSVVTQCEQGEIRVVKRMRLEHADRAAMRNELAKLAQGSGVTGYIRKTGNAELLLREIERFIAEFHRSP